MLAGLRGKLDMLHALHALAAPEAQHITDIGLTLDSRYSDKAADTSVVQQAHAMINSLEVHRPR